MAYKRIDLTGQRFGKLIAVSINTEKEAKGSTTYWNCVCDCGNTTVASTSNLRQGNKLSCGCIRKNDLTGKRFSRLLVLERSNEKYKTKNGKEYPNSIYVCQCDCGNIIHCLGGNLLKGRTTSCGCFQKDCTSKRFSKHGMRRSRLYNCWVNMRSRCNNQKNKAYKNYGERGITVCNEWDNSFEEFMKWALSNGYSEELTIDRIDVNGNYCPNNCRWATTEQQANNQRKTIRIEISGIEKSLKQWTNFMGWKYGTYTARHVNGREPFTKEEICLIQEKIRSENNG